jgi:hypothetical protein
LAFGFLALALGLVGWALMTGEMTNAGIFFGAGALVLLSGLTAMSWWLTRNSIMQTGTTRALHLTVPLLIVRGLARRRSRSVATAALLACGAFLIFSIGVFRLDATRDATARSAGTGGFALIGESTVPVVKDLNTTAGREFFALDDNRMENVTLVPFRVRQGDEASCLNLNRAQTPRLMGVDPDAMKGRFTFAKAAKGLNRAEGWHLLQSQIGNPESGMEEVPAIGDLNSIVYAMGKGVGETIDYEDDRGRRFKVRIVGAVANSILQGNLVIDEEAFMRQFPQQGGHNYFLIDAPSGQADAVASLLSRSMEDYGMEVTPTTRRLEAFNAVQNTYLGTFQIIGGLGLLLGSAGLGIVVMRNVLERRGDLAVLVAVGFRRQRVARLILAEHAGLLGLGLAIGLAAAALAVLPTLLAPGAQIPYASIVPTLLGVLLNGLIWTGIASRMATRGNLLAALRNE